MNKDNYEEALERLYSVMVFLYGGYYEPKSDRDKELADDLHNIWLKYRQKKNRQEKTLLRKLYGLYSRV